MLQKRFCTESLQEERINPSIVILVLPLNLGSRNNILLTQCFAEADNRPGPNVSFSQRFQIDYFHTNSANRSLKIAKMKSVIKSSQ